MKNILVTAAAASLAALMTAGALPAADPLEEWDTYARAPEARRLKTWMRCIMRQELTGIPCTIDAPAGSPSFFGRHGIFVTLIRGSRVRGCYGAFFHKSDDLRLVLLEYLCGALRCDPRHTPLSDSEYDDTDIVITVTGGRFPVEDPEAIDISRHGLVITLEDGGQLVFVPAEFRSVDYMKSKIPRSGVVQIAGFRAVSLR